MENSINIYNGCYKGIIDGINSTLIISQDNNSVKGELYKGSSKYDLTGVVITDSIHGKLTDVETLETYIVLAEFSGGTLKIDLTMHDMKKCVSESNTYNFELSDNNEIIIKDKTETTTTNDIDRELIGTWAKEEVLSATAFTVHTKMLIELNEKGQYKILGAKRLDGYKDKGYSGDTTSGKWKTRDNTFYVQVSGSRYWKPYARYEIKGRNMIFILGDHDRQVWSRV